MLVALVAFFLAIAFSVGVSVLISQPFSGAITRLRANYLPKAVSLDNVLEDGHASSATNPRAISAFLLAQRRSSAKIGPVVPGVLSMLARTKRLEGWAGVYKGAAPVAMQLILLSTITFLFSGTQASAAGGQYKAAPSAPGQFGFWSNLFYMLFVSLVALPLNVITYRTIVHPRILPWNTPRQNLRELLSYHEHAQPWRLYLLPGLLAANVAHVAWIGLATRIVRQIAVPSLGGLDPATPAAPGQDEYSGPNSSMLEVSSFGLAVFVTWNVLSVLVLAPLEVVMVRLSTQQPERHNPLHRAYARMSTSGGSSGGAPAPYNNQATVAAQTQPGGGYSDAATPQQPSTTVAAGGGGGTDAKTGDEPLPSRPSFAIDDEEADDDDHDTESPRQDGEAARPKRSPSDEAGDKLASSPRRPLGAGGMGSTPSFPGTSSSGGIVGGNGNGEEPPEPVIALRPIEEQSAEAAAAEFGAPVVARYEGVWDCVSKMVDEEGLESLGRGAWVTLLGVFAGAFS